MKTFLKILSIPFIILFGPMAALVLLGIAALILGDSGGAGLNIVPGNVDNLLEENKEHKQKWWYKFVSILFWKKNEPIWKFFLRLIFIQIPFFSILITFAMIASIEWSTLVFKTLFNVDIKPFLDFLYLD